MGCKLSRSSLYARAGMWRLHGEELCVRVILRKKIKLSLSYGVFSGTCRTFEFHTVKTQEPHTHTHTCTHTTAQPFNGRWSRTTRVGRYQKKHSPTHTHPDHQTSFINFLHLLRSIASSVFSLRAWQSSVWVLFGLPLGLGPSTFYAMHFKTQEQLQKRKCQQMNK